VCRAMTTVFVVSASCAILFISLLIFARAQQRAFVESILCCQLHTLLRYNDVLLLLEIDSRSQTTPMHGYNLYWIDSWVALSRTRPRCHQCPAATTCCTWARSSTATSVTWRRC
jgi:hypothetical protein